MPRIVVAGSLNMDLVMQSPRVPVLGETIPAGPFVTSHGGKGANQAVACSRMGASVAMAGRVGDDAFGCELRESLEREGVDISAVLTTEGCFTGVASIVVVEGDNGILIAFDPNYRPRLWQDRAEAQAAVTAALAVTDIAAPTFPDEQALFGDATPEATAERLMRQVGEVVVKNGEAPALAAAAGGTWQIPAQHVADPVDTTGAGDAFNGGYLAARLAGHAPAEAARRAHRVAAAAVQVRGALAPFEVLQAAFAG